MNTKGTWRNSRRIPVKAEATWLLLNKQDMKKLKQTIFFTLIKPKSTTKIDAFYFPRH